MSSEAVTRATLTTTNNASPEIEARLMEKIARGDRTAFEQLYDRMQARVLGLAVRLLRDRAQAEEIAQDVFLEVWQGAARFDAERGTAVGWILRKTHSRAVDRIRAAESRNARDTMVGLRALVDTGDDIEDVVSARVDSERVRNALAGLPGEQRQVVALAHLEGYSHSELAQLLDLPVGTVKSRIRAGLTRMRQGMAVA